jgi:cysteinyl-tRNA synthetase
MDTLATEFESFRALHIQEQYAAPARIESLQDSVQQQNDFERKLQLRYENLIVERENWKSLIRERDAAVARAKEEAWAAEEACMAVEAEVRANAARAEAESKAAEESEMAIDTDLATAEALKEAVETAATSAAISEAAMAAEESEMAIDTDLATAEAVKEAVDTSTNSAAMSEAAMESKATMVAEEFEMAIHSDLATAEAVKEVVDTAASNAAMSDAAVEANGREIVEEVISGNRVGIPEVVSNADDGAVFTITVGDNASASGELSEMVSNASGVVGSVAKEEVVIANDTVSKMVSELAKE